MGYHFASYVFVLLSLLGTPFAARVESDFADDGNAAGDYLVFAAQGKGLQVLLGYAKLEAHGAASLSVRAYDAGGGDSAVGEHPGCPGQIMGPKASSPGKPVSAKWSETAHSLTLTSTAYQFDWGLESGSGAGAKYVIPGRGWAFRSDLLQSARPELRNLAGELYEKPDTSGKFRPGKAGLTFSLMTLGSGNVIGTPVLDCTGGAAGKCVSSAIFGKEPFVYFNNGHLFSYPCLGPKNVGHAQMGLIAWRGAAMEGIVYIEQSVHSQGNYLAFGRYH